MWGKGDRQSLRAKMVTHWQSKESPSRAGEGIVMNPEHQGEWEVIGEPQAAVATPVCSLSTAEDQRLGFSHVEIP